MQQRPAAALASIERFFQFSILGLVASGYMAIVGSGYVDWATVILAGIGLIWRAAIISGARRWEPPPAAITAATVAYMVFAPIDYLYLEKTWIAATIHVVFFVASVKTLTARTSRDYLFVSAVAFMQLLAAAIFSTSISFFICLGFYLLCAVAARSAAEIRRVSEGEAILATGARSRITWRVAGLSTIVAASILVLTAGLFFILPRTANAALHLFASSRYHLTGFSDDVNLGEVGELKKDTRAVMHVRALPLDGYGKSSELPLNLKWRGLALERFDGHRWSTDAAGFHTLRQDSGLLRVAADWERRRKGRRIVYRVEIQNVDADALFVAGEPEFLNVGQARVARSRTGAFRFRFTPAETLRYEVYSFLGPESPPPPGAVAHLAAGERAEDLELPPLDHRIPGLARAITRGAQSDGERASAIEKYLRRTYGYSLELPSQQERDPIAAFLFETKKGYCEHFASAMAVMLRSLNIPARIVTGFQSGVRNPYSRTVVIRASDAHSWVEAFLPEQGWTVFDPTPLLDSAPQETIWSKLNLFLDAADTFWRDWIVRYDLSQQITLASHVEMEARRIREEGLWARALWLIASTPPLAGAPTAGRVLLGLAAVVMVLAAWLKFRRLPLRPRVPQNSRAGSREATEMYIRMLRAMKKRGYQKPAWFTPEEFATSVPNWPGEELEQFTEAYYAARFGEKPSGAEEMTAALKRLSERPERARV